MRLTVLHSDKGPNRVRATDVEVHAGTSVATLRREIARLTGRPEWASLRTTLTADGIPVDDSHPAGLTPVLPGAVLSVGAPSAVPPERRVLTCGRHLAVVAGPDSGTLLPVELARSTTVGPGGELVVRDDVWQSPLRLRVRAPRRRPWGTRAGRRHGPVVLVRTTGDAVLARPGSARRRRLPRRRWARWPVGAAVHVGVSVLELREVAPRPRAGGPPSQGTAPNGPGRTAEPRGRRGGRGGGFAAMAASTVGTTVTGVVLAVAVHQPLLALTSLTGPLLWWANRRTAAAPATPGDAVDGRPADIPSLRLAVALGAPGTDLTVPAPWDDEGCLAVVGADEPVLAAARAVVLGELGSRGRCPVTVRGRNVPDWAWLVWSGAASRALPGRGASGADSDPSSRALVVVDGSEDATEVTRWRAHAPATQRLLWVGRGDAAAPAWCRNVLSVTAAGSALRSGHGAPRVVPSVGVRADVAETHARALARATQVPGATVAGPSTTVDGLRLSRCPDTAALVDLPGTPAPAASAVATAWSAPPPGLRTPFGEGPDGCAVWLDLVRDGPHAVVAGTTGAGKSELLTTLVLGLALTYPPRRLAVLLVDFKGGTGLPGLITLPHVVGRLSDLDAAGARRVLLGLGAELRRRERIVARAGVRDVQELQPAVGRPVPPRLLVVIDEFRALADDLPELVPGLARVAAQGRSLGVHLVLATQRPAGAVPAELRANVSLRVALRVVDAADSVDLVGVADAARIESGTPGRCVLVRGGGAAEAVQVARAGASGGHRRVELARPAAEAVGAGPTEPTWRPAARDAGTAPDPVACWVAAAQAAAAGMPPPDVPWLPELPERVTVGDLAAGPGLALALADVPEEQRRTTVRWRPDDGHLLVLGGPRSGRSTTLVTVGRQALLAGRDVHALGLPPSAVEALRAAVPAGLGTAAAVGDVVTAARLLDALTRGLPASERPVLLVDRLDRALDELASVARGAGAQLLTSLWERSDPPVCMAASAPVSPLSSRLLGSFPDRLVLAVADPTLDALAGVPSALSAPRLAPGRAVHVRAAGAVLCQVALADDVQATPPAQRQDSPLRLCAPPSTAPWRGVPARLTADGRLHVPLGLGADGHGVVEVDLTDALLIVGPAGSGRTTALAGVARAIEHLGIATCRAAELLETASGAPPLQLLERLAPGGEVALLLDDLDDLERTDAHLALELAERLGEQRRGAGAAPPLRLVAATSTAHAVASYRGLVPTMLRSRRLVVLDPREPGSLDLIGSQARWLVDPAGAPPGHGVLRRDGQVVPVQLWAPHAD
ncbi:FtsK/SpoIIIE domain-containing protein [Cellulomonas sp. SG140]|uniref:FtsK/SpoIIIE domain-containing protein n=1 Tax=Cellulomonas sp. SG140 TaxID=2976536 RepID=UPI0021E9A92B|nr:FtsK/SpoIIIE domain-containing protein [Cellulomonas sp. SG140]